MCIGMPNHLSRIRGRIVAWMAANETCAKQSGAELSVGRMQGPVMQCGNALPDMVIFSIYAELEGKDARQLAWGMSKYFAMHYDLQDSDGKRFETTLWAVVGREKKRLCGNAMPKAKEVRDRGYRHSFVELVANNIGAFVERDYDWETADANVGHEQNKRKVHVPNWKNDDGRSGDEMG